jgi:hypothetical protein
MTPQSLRALAEEVHRKADELGLSAVMNPTDLDPSERSFFFAHYMNQRPVQCHDKYEAERIVFVCNNVQKLARAVKELMPFVRHKGLCLGSQPANGIPEGQEACTCGLDAALARIGEVGR